MVVDAHERQQREHQRSAEGESPSFECEYEFDVAGDDDPPAATIPSAGTQHAVDASFGPAAKRIELPQDEVLPP